jgi:UDP-galactopyranose mutase
MQRIPVRFTYDNNYYSDPYQGVPKGGYTSIILKMTDGCDIWLNMDYNKNRQAYRSLAHKVIYTGTIDSYFDYCFGPLEYRSLRFETEELDMENYQGVAVVNYTDEDTPFTRVIEHKHFEFGTQKRTVISREYPVEWTMGIEPYYPINSQANQNRYEQYDDLSKKEENVIFGGRLGMYRYTDMQDTIISALSLASEELET